MPGVILGALAYIASLKCHKNLLEGIKDYSETGNPSKSFQLETFCVCFCFVVFFCLGSHGGGGSPRGSYTSKKKMMGNKILHYELIQVKVGTDEMSSSSLLNFSAINRFTKLRSGHSI